MVTAGMTALKEFARLESLGLWKQSKDAQRQEVVVSFGASSLVLSDTNGNPLTHWSLAAITWQSKANKATVFGIDAEGAETLEIEDETMVAAIEKVRRAVEKSRPRPGRLRRWISLSLFLLVIGALFLWLPSVAAKYATSVVPDAKAQEIGDKALAHLTKLTGLECESVLGKRSLRQLEQRLIGAPSNQISIVSMGTRKSALLPGGHILISRSLLDDDEGPEVLAGYVLLERGAQDETPELLELFQSAGLRETLRFLVNGKLSEGLIETYAEARLTGPRASPSVENLAGMFDGAELSSAPFIVAEPRYKALFDTDGYRDGYAPLLSDNDWLALREICG